MKFMGNEAIFYSDVLYCENLFKNFIIINALDSLSKHEFL